MAKGYSARGGFGGSMNNSMNSLTGGLNIPGLL